MAMWQIDEIGRLTSFGEFGYSGVDQIAAAVAPHSTSGFFLAGRQSPFYTDADHSTINNGDEALIKFVSASGTEAWSILIDSAGGGGGDDTNQVAVDVINDGNDDFLVLINRQYSEFGTQDFRVMMVSASGNVYWDKKYTISNTNVFAQKIVKRANGHYLILANDVDNGIPILYEISGTGVYETHEEYPQANAVNCFGITNNKYNQPSSGYRLAGFQDNGADQDGFIIKVDNGLSEVSTNVIENPITGNESFRDIVAHPTGYLAIGECDNRGEGQRDVWICHLDTLADTLKIETLGGEETDFGHSVTLIPSVFSAFIAGYNNSYSIEESGNAYLSGVKVDMGLPESGECKVHRTMQVDFFVWHDGSGGIDLSNYILNDSQKEQDLIDFAVDNEINYLVLFGSNFIFDPNYYSGSLTARQALSSFIAKCAQKNIQCGLVSNPTLGVFTNGIQYNMDVANNSSTYNYNRSGKLTYFMLEHEFWRANDVNLFPNSPIQSPGQMDAFYQGLYGDHKTLLTDLNNNKDFDANVHGLHDYIQWFYHSWSNTSNNSYNWSNTTARKNKAAELEKLSDAIFLVYYQKYSAPTGTPKGEEGHDFLATNATAGDRLFNVNRWKERLSYLGKNTARETEILPLFSNEIDYNGTVCGEGDFLGRYLEDTPGNGTGSVKSTETFYQSQHATIYANTSSYPDIINTKVSSLAWFKYSCMKDKDFEANSGRVDCDIFNRKLSKEEHFINSNEIILYPNPNNGTFHILSEKIALKDIKVFDTQGRLIKSKTFEDNIQHTQISDLNTGIYYISILDTERNIHHKKVSIVE